LKKKKIQNLIIASIAILIVGSIAAYNYSAEQTKQKGLQFGIELEQIQEEVQELQIKFYSEKTRWNEGDISKEGWIFDPEEGQRIQGKYIFGEKVSVSKEELKFSLGGTELQAIQSKKVEFDESIAVVIIITIVSIAAALFYLKGYKK